ncbi:MAG TPA: indolepyruvate ferredoxin oxidoreductase, partial [Kosmotogaceae bacterium]|nr:indolepyruvate ferredoxin oxidoreductase [Kosmotogaceae bacterium]
MKKLGDMLTSREPASEIMIGNTAVVRAMIESGVRVATSYPGSPTPEIAQAIVSIPSDQNPIYFEFSVNEKVATEVAFGASINGHLSCVFFKSVGLNVASDTFVQLSLMELPGGMVVVIGDDPGANSSQNEQDNRHYALMSYTPVFEPSTPQEAYAMFKEAARISKEMRMPVIMRLTTHVCHAKEKVAFSSWSPEQTEKRPLFSMDNGPYIPITSVSLNMKRRALEKLERFRDYSEDSPLNRIIRNGSEKGIITSGTAYLSLMDSVIEMSEKPDILKLGIVNPLPLSLIEDFLKEHSEVKILEELDQIIEQQVKSLAFDRRIGVKIIGKDSLEDFVGEYLPDKVRGIISRTWPELIDPPEELSITEEIPSRPAQMCPGCGHRSAFFAIKEALNEQDITVADIGCHTLGAFEPYNMGQVLLCMGHCSGTGSGLSLFNKERRVLAFIGDSTLFHAGLPGIINAVYNSHRMTLVVMENGTTA